MEIAVIGASGRTGTRFVRRALAEDHEVVAYVREIERLDVDRNRVTTVVGDAYTGTGLEDAIEGTDAVVCAVGHVEGSPRDLLTVVGENVIDVMEVVGTERYVTLVSVDVVLDGHRGGSWIDRIERGVSNVLDEPDVDDAHRHVECVVDREVDWTVVRAARLTDEPASGGYDHGSFDLDGTESVPRADVADFLLDVLEDERYVRELPMVIGT